MSIPRLDANSVGLPIFDISDEDMTADISAVSFFDLSSHCRARSSMDFGLKMRALGGNVFVIGADHSGRMTSTLAFLNQYIQQLPAPPDWVYLNNFMLSHRPRPFRLPAGEGVKLKTMMQELIDTIEDVLEKLFSNSIFVKQVNSLTAALQESIQSEIEKLQKIANQKGLNIYRENNEFAIVEMEATESTPSQKTYSIQDVHDIQEKLNQIMTNANNQSRETNKKIQQLKKQEAEKALKPILAPFIEAYAAFLGDWIDEFKEDIITRIDDFLNADESKEASEELHDRYTVNLFVDNRTQAHPNVIIEPSPTYENLFGKIKYKTGSSGYYTDFSMIRAGNLHRANGGILVVRAEALVSNPDAWESLKMALRDKVIRIEERYRENSMPILDAPDPYPIPLDVQIFIVGAPVWYYNYFFNDSNFRAYFKIRADIENDMPTTPENISVYARLIRKFAQENGKKDIAREAIQYLIGYSSRWVGHRHSINARFELIIDIVNESCVLAEIDKVSVIALSHVQEALNSRRARNGSMEDRVHKDIENGLVVIETDDAKIGQTNGLGVLTVGEHQFGIPNRISARTYVGKQGLINIERLTDMSGPIQQKGTLILDGFLKGLFVQHCPVSFECTLTFEQSYNEIEGDSASMAELLAIISSLSNVPIRQEIAVTGSVDQFGRIQGVGGLSHKIEGFFRLCKYRGFTGTQGVIIPKSNVDHVIVRDEVKEAVKQGIFSIWAVQTIEEAIELIMDTPAGVANKKGFYPPNSVYAQVLETLKRYNGALNGKGNKGK